MNKLAIVLAIVIGAVGSVSAQGVTKRWKLVEVDGMNVRDASNAYIEVSDDQTRFTGNTGCNRMFGGVEIQGRRVDFSNVGTTRMACVEPRARRVETAFVKALENADRFRERGNLLELYDRSRVVARLSSPPQQTVSLEDRKWVLDGAGKLGQTAFVVFDKKKQSAGGNSSCNVFGGNYTTKGESIKFTDIISTMRACVEDERMSIERDFMDGLQNANRYEIKGEKLMLYREKKLLLTFVGERK